MKKTSHLTPQKISTHVLEEKYCRPDENLLDVQKRIAKALASVERENTEYWEKRFLKAMRSGFIPGGRIMASAGVETGATLINCFVQPIKDSMEGITDALSKAAETMRRGGGVGYDFSPIRPRGAWVQGTNSRASGPVSYMRVFNEMCSTVESAGSRRGAQMAILRCDHPDILEFISCKDRPGEMTNFNISVAVTDDFIKAVQDDALWQLTHTAQPTRESEKQEIKTKKQKNKHVYGSIPAKKLWANIMRSTYDHAEPGVLFIDQVNQQNNLHYCERIASTNPCGEQPLPPHGCCDLGSINLTKLIKKPFTSEAYVNFEKLEDLTNIAVRMLDNVLDATTWPLPEQQIEAMHKRRIGLGIMGLGDALLMLGLAYNSQEGRMAATEIMRKIRDSAYSASIALAKSLGAFPLFKAKDYLKSSFIAQLPENIKHDIQQFGIRNSHLLSIAPTGTIALAFGDNVSSGIEPPYAWTYQRKKRMPDGEHQDFIVQDHAYRLFCNFSETTKPELPENWKTAGEISPMDHIMMLAALQPYVDSAISKTVNVPENCSFSEFETLYMHAWFHGLKGLTTYRPNKITGSILSEIPKEPKKIDKIKKVIPSQDKPILEIIDSSKPSTLNSDKRISLEVVPKPTLASLRWQRRPMPPAGNRAWSYVVRHSLGKFAVFVGEIQDQDKRLVPFECWVNGEEQPRGIGALAKSLSMDMRSADSGWLKKKLSSLTSLFGEDNFDMPLPPSGEVKRMPSLVAGFAHLVQYYCEELNVFRDDAPTPVLDALIYPPELIPGPDGTLSWTVDIENPNTHDEITLGLKELEMPDGTRRPYSLWLAGRYPRALDGLCASLSLDMRVIDPAWIGAKLRQIIDFHEPLGDFMAKEPTTNRKKLYLSTIAYIARLLIHRYAMLGILDEQGIPIEDMGIMHITGNRQQQTTEAKKSHSVGAVETVPGRCCGECGSYTLIRRDGCSFCTSCGYVGDCG